MELMDRINLPDGTTLQVPAGSSPEFIKAEVQKATSPTFVEGVAGPIVRGVGSAMEMMGGDSRRSEKARDIFLANFLGDQSKTETSLQASGQVAGKYGDVIGEGLSLAGQGLSAITPDVIEDRIVDAVTMLGQTELMQMGKRALQSGLEEWSEFSQEHPRAARNIEAITNIAGVGVPTRLGASALAKSTKPSPLIPTSAQSQARIDIESGGMPATKSSTAEFRLEDSPVKEATSAPIGPKALGLESRDRFSVPESGKIAVVNPMQKEAIRQGFDEGLVAMIREASPADRKNMLRSLAIMEQATGNKRFSMLNRTTDVAGESIIKRYKLIQRENLKAGRSLDRYARTVLKNKYVNFDQPVNNFNNALKDMGINFKDDLTLDFSGSTIEELAGAERLLNLIVKRMRSPRDMTAFEVHKFKQFIDQQVTHGKMVDGLSGEAERVVKNLRRELDEVLDANFSGYDKANSKYAETINAMDNFRSSVGRTIDLDSPQAITGVGTKLRALDSNIQSRGNLLASLDEMETIAKKYGADFDDDLINQAAFTIELDKIFGTKASTSLGGVIESSLPRGKTDLAMKFGEAAVDKLRGINEQAQFKAMKDLLNSFD